RPLLVDVYTVYCLNYEKAVQFAASLEKDPVHCQWMARRNLLLSKLEDQPPQFQPIIAEVSTSKDRRPNEFYGEETAQADYGSTITQEKNSHMNEYSSNEVPPLSPSVSLDLISITAESLAISPTALNQSSTGSDCAVPDQSATFLTPSQENTDPVPSIWPLEFDIPTAADRAAAATAISSCRPLLPLSSRLLTP
ncbi:unnamed protein product, partial [Protopolystoma xenopodis]